MRKRKGDGKRKKQETKPDTRINKPNILPFQQYHIKLKYIYIDEINKMKFSDTNKSSKNNMFCDNVLRIESMKH